MTTVLSPPSSSPFVSSSMIGSTETLDAAADHNACFEHLNRMRDREAVNVMEHFIENEMRYQHFIERVTNQRKQIGKVCIKKAMEKTKEICDAMIKVLRDQHKAQLTESEDQRRALNVENQRLRQMNGTMLELLNRAQSNGFIIVDPLTISELQSSGHVPSELKVKNESDQLADSGDPSSSSLSLPPVPPLDVVRAPNSSNHFKMEGLGLERNSILPLVDMHGLPSLDIGFGAPPDHGHFDQKPSIQSMAMWTDPVPNDNGNRPKKSRKRSRNTHEGSMHRIPRTKKPRWDPKDDRYAVSVNCKECGEHFDDFDRYRSHLKAHFERNPHWKWRYCPDVGDTANNDPCDLQKFWNSDIMFIAHLTSMHGYQRPFQCTLIKDGAKCTYSCATKYGVRNHMLSCAKRGSTTAVTKEEKPLLSTLNNS